MCRSRPWNDFLSRDSYAERADDEEAKVTYAVPFGSLVVLSMGMWTYMHRDDKSADVQTAYMIKGRFRKILAIYFPRFSTLPQRGV